MPLRNWKNLLGFQPNIGTGNGSEQGNSCVDLMLAAVDGHAAQI
jgi:hypothetical protein